MPQNAMCRISVYRYYITTVCFLLMSAGIFAASLAEEISIAPGWPIFIPQSGYDYRYGPSMIINDDHSIDAWFASPGGLGGDKTNQWDWIRHKHSKDGGKTWGPETIVLKPSEGLRDQISVCDPGVIKFGGWYYLGVTAVEDPKGNDNEIFVARSRTATGPFAKWNGKSWGGNRPMPLIKFRNPTDVWGAGEPSFVLKDNQIFIYYTILSRDDKGTSTSQTWEATAPVDTNWPAKVTLQGMAWNREIDEDSVDVKYCDQLGKFIALSTASRMGPNAHLLVRESADGLHWSKPAKLTQNVKPWCHNVGISGTGEGHLDLDRKNYIGYAYSNEPKINWGVWHTSLHPITIKVAAPDLTYKLEKPTAN